MSHLKNDLLIAFMVIFLFSMSKAQSPQNSSISVTVKDQFGEVIPDAEISLSKVNQEEKRRRSNQQGLALFSFVEAGEYQVNITAKGFTRCKSEVFVLKKGEQKKLEFTLEIEQIESNVTVGGEQSIDMDKFGAAKVLSEADLSNLSDDPTEFEKEIRAMAGESITGEQMPISVNGQEGARIPPRQAIQQVRVNQNIFSAQYENTSGAGIEITTRSSVDKFRGRVGLGFADSHFNASDAFIGRRIPMQARYYNLNLSGPVNKKTAFFVFGSFGENDASATINAKILDSTLRPIEYKGTFATPTRDNSLYLTLTSDVSKKSKVAINYAISTSDSKGQNVGGFSLESRAASAQSQNQNFSISNIYVVNPNVVNQARFSVNYSLNKAFGGSNDYAVNVLEAFYGGGAQNNNRNKTWDFETANDTTWQIGRYWLAFGGRLRGKTIDQNSTANFGGTYTFSGRTGPVLDAANNPILDAGGNVVITQIDSLEVYRRTLLFRQLGFPAAQIRSLGGGASQFTISGGDPRVAINQYDIALYEQNSYRLSETVALSFGLRYENQTNISSHLNLSPRVGVIWSPKANPKKKNPIYALPRISAGFGVFFRRFDINNFLGIGQSTGDRSQYLITDPAVLDIFPNVATVAQLQQFALPSSQRFIDKDLQSAYQNLFSVTAAKPLPLGFSSTFTFLRSNAFRQPFTSNINAPLAGTFDPLVENSGVRPVGSAGDIYETFSDGRAINTRISASLGFPEKYISGRITFSFTKAKNDSVAGSGSPTNAYDFSQEYAPAANDGMRRIDGYASYSRLPYKFSVELFYSIISGTRFNIITGRDTNGDGFYLERPSFATDLTKQGLISTPYGILDPNPSPTDKLIPRNLGRGNTFYDLDAGLSKSFAWGEDKANKKPAKHSLYFGVRINNLLNHVNKGNPIGNMSSPNFLKSLSNSDGGNIVIINGIRSTSGNRTLTFSSGFSF
jgi:hypothetical protein